jgi:hypothetical protein
VEEQLPEYKQYPDTEEGESSSPPEQERVNVMATAMIAASRGVLNTPCLRVMCLFIVNLRYWVVCCLNQNWPGFLEFAECEQVQ